MFNWITRWFSRPVIQSTHTLYTELPYHIQQTGRLYPVIETLVGNKADGEIRKFNLEENKLRIGQALFQKNQTEIWIHLGNDYFKNTVKL